MLTRSTFFFKEMACDTEASEGDEVLLDDTTHASSSTSVFFLYSVVFSPNSFTLRQAK